MGVADCNHKEMCKFDSASSQKYLPVWYSIRDIVQDVLKGGSEPGKWSLISLDTVVEDYWIWISSCRNSTQKSSPIVIDCQARYQL